MTTLKEFTEIMENEYNAYWTSFLLHKQLDQPSSVCRIQYNDERINQEIVQIDSAGISTGNESLMINFDFWTEEITEPIKTTCKMLGSDLEQCMKVIKEILQRIEVHYISIH